MLNENDKTTHPRSPTNPKHKKIKRITQVNDNQIAHNQ
jgi:hypothetical protein